MKKANRTSGPAQGSTVEPPPVAPVVELRVNPRDLVFIATALNKTAWTGGEQRVLGLTNIYKTLRLAKVDLGILPTVLKPVEIVKLPPPHVETLIRALCGEGMGNQAFGGDIGPLVGDSVMRLRAAIKDAKVETTTESK